MKTENTYQGKRKEQKMKHEEILESLKQGAVIKETWRTKWFFFRWLLWSTKYELLSAPPASKMLGKISHSEFHKLLLGGALKPLQVKDSNGEEGTTIFYYQVLKAKNGTIIYGGSGSGKARRSCNTEVKEREV